MVQIGYRPWLVRCVGILLVTVMLVVIAEHGVRLRDVNHDVPRITLPASDQAFSESKLIDVRIPNPGGGPTAPLGPPGHGPVAAGSAVVLESDDQDRRWSVMLSPPGSPGGRS